MIAHRFGSGLDLFVITYYFVLCFFRVTPHLPVPWKLGPHALSRLGTLSRVSGLEMCTVVIAAGDPCCGPTPAQARVYTTSPSDSASVTGFLVGCRVHD